MKVWSCDHSSTSVSCLVPVSISIVIFSLSLFICLWKLNVFVFFLFNCVSKCSCYFNVVDVFVCLVPSSLSPSIYLTIYISIYLSLFLFVQSIYAFLALQMISSSFPPSLILLSDNSISISSSNNILSNKTLSTHSPYNSETCLWNYYPLSFLSRHDLSFSPFSPFSPCLHSGEAESLSVSYFLFLLLFFCLTCYALYALLLFFYFILALSFVFALFYLFSSFAFNH